MTEVKTPNTPTPEERLSTFEHWVNENRKLLSYILGGLFGLIALYFLFTRFYLEPRNKEANDQIFWAQKWFGMDSLNKALNGDGNYPGFLSIQDDYRWTDAANLSHYYAGIIYLKQGQFEEAIDQLRGFKGKDKMVTNMAFGALGDAYSETGDYEEAVNYYKKAAYHFENELTSPMYLKKAGMMLEYQKKPAEAKKIYEEIRNKYPNTVEGREMEKYIGRAEAAANE